MPPPFSAAPAPQSTQPAFPAPAFAFALALTLALAGCAPPPPDSFQGYIEADYVHVASPVGGLLLQCEVRRGDNVQAGDPLFTLESGLERAAVEEAERRVALAEARLDNLLKGRRPTEIAALEARAAQGRASLEFWTAEFQRRQQLARDQVIAEAEIDQARTQRNAAQAALDAAEADLATARLGGREDEIQAAAAERDAMRAVLDRARWALGQKSQSAPLPAIVHEILFRPGEFVPPGAGAVVLLPPENLFVRFFVPSDQLGAMTPGRQVEIRHDGSDTPIPGRIRHVATRAEFTPPVIYSRDTRAKLVFRVEAEVSPGVAASLRPGQPVEVRLP
ncbi:MAG: HlyD family efflux transporter periplasmic adaptor subunit [Verrucomicrobiae bacterium]|nr:HlyD family efflux transporter periplasmic adaptor subunit [Verrucomicrobiae bacterium]